MADPHILGSSASANNAAFKRDVFDAYQDEWDRAMQQYEHSLAAERMANVSYDPNTRTFGVSNPPGAAQRLQQELLAPLQAKYAPLFGRSSANVFDRDEPKIFNTSAGVVERTSDGSYVNRFPVDRRATIPRALELKYQSLLRERERLGSGYGIFSDTGKARMADINRQIDDMEKSFSSPSAPPRTPASVPTRPVAPAAPAGPPSGFIGAPGGTSSEELGLPAGVNLFDPEATPFGFRQAPQPPPAASVRRFKWVQGQLQPAQ